MLALVAGLALDPLLRPRRVVSLRFAFHRVARSVRLTRIGLVAASGRCLMKRKIAKMMIQKSWLGGSRAALTVLSLVVICQLRKCNCELLEGAHLEKSHANLVPVTSVQQ